MCVGGVRKKGETEEEGIILLEFILQVGITPKVSCEAGYCRQDWGGDTRR